MADTAKFLTKLNSVFSLLRTRRRMMVFTYGFMFLLVAATIFLVFNPGNSSSSPWLNRIFTNSTLNSNSYKTVYYYFFPDDQAPQGDDYNRYSIPNNQTSIFIENSASLNATNDRTSASFNMPTPSNSSSDRTSVAENSDTTAITSNQASVVAESSASVAKNSNSGNQTSVAKNSNPSNQTSVAKNSNPSNQTSVAKNSNSSNRTSVSGNATSTFKNVNSSSITGSFGKGGKKVGDSNSTAVGQSNVGGSASGQKAKATISLERCNLYDGRWVRDQSYPLYPPGSCTIDEQYNCFRNGRPDREHQMFRWQPKGCNIPRLNGTDMLERLRGKRLVFVGDSLNRNMWESLLCILKNSLKDKSRVYEVSGKHDFKSRGFFSFIFKDYNCSVEFFWAPFLVREWEVPESNGTTKETLRLDLIESSSPYYKKADVIVFNTGHWWTHEKTSRGKDYYQEGSHVYSELNVLEAFRRAITTWGRWVDANINPKKTTVLFRGYSASHFSGGQWNSGGQCGDEIEPIMDDSYLAPYPDKMIALESVLKGMKFPVYYMNVTRLTDYRKDGHPSVYRKQNMSEAERRGRWKIQDCSHWCLPGVPDAWNELLYAHLIAKKQQH